MAKVGLVSVLIMICVTFIPNTKIVKGGEIGVQLQSCILMILPVLPVQGVVSQTKEPRLRIVYVSSLIQGEIRNLRESTKDVAMLTQGYCQGVFFVIAMLMEGVGTEPISSSSIQ